MKFIDFFAGIGGFRKGMELAGHECVGFCEFDKFATASYTSMHLITEEQREVLNKMPLKQRQKEILKEEHRNGEWYANDIRRVYAEDIPKADCWCFGFPCQDISVAGKQLGFQGNRSSLFFRVMYLVGQLEEENKPTYLFIENVKNLLSANGGWDFARLLVEMEQNGYDAEWQVLNPKDFGVPQNRERVFIIGHLRRCGATKILPVTGADGENRVSVIAHRNGMQTFSKKSITESLEIGRCGVREHHVPVSIENVQCININDCYGKERPQQDRVYGINGQMTALNAQLNGRHNIAVPVLTPDRTEKKQNGRRFKENGEPMFTLTGQDRHGVTVEVVQTECSENENGIYVQFSNGVVCYAVWYEKYQCYIAIRKLTPRECFRLQGWTDDYFEKAAFVNSDSQLYKQAGNSVTVHVIKAIGERIK